MTNIDSIQCAKCREIKPLPEFNRCSANPSGVQAYCRPCESAYKTNRNGTLEIKASRAVRRSRQKAKGYGVADTLTLAEVREIFSADHCDYCNAHLEQSEKTLEHVIPFEQGGGNTFGNVTLACRDCNSRKYTTPAFEFILLNGDAVAARRLLDVLAERNGIEPQEYLYTLAKAGIEYRKDRIRRLHGFEAEAR